ncbi:unnamed protein product [Dovyalis caffra]|uniref:Uncharacterized protein n=1 Tax=Dovyalis caffra TaxID=77055 RepID=A0AAV1RH77_9ROSI|nr:unnamed protein product [Dovyalis caffra]
MIVGCGVVATRRGYGSTSYGRCARRARYGVDGPVACDPARRRCYSSKLPWASSRAPGGSLGGRERGDRRLEASDKAFGWQARAYGLAVMGMRVGSGVLATYRLS